LTKNASHNIHKNRTLLFNKLESEANGIEVSENIAKFLKSSGPVIEKI